MSLLRAILGPARSVRPAPAVADGLPPDDGVLLDAPDGRLAPALVSAALGDHRPAARLLAATRDAARWEDRDRYVVRLAAFAHGRGEWLTRWLEDDPRDADALIVDAQLAVRRAWESPARAERLREVGPLIDRAAEAAPRDPVPWRVALDHARGTRAPHRVFASLWEQAVRRAPHHYGCHVSALAYLSAQCCGVRREAADPFQEAGAPFRAPGDTFVPGDTFQARGDSPRVPGDTFRVPGGTFVPDGSSRVPGGPARPAHGAHSECFDFAEQAALDALPDSLIQALPVRAALTRLVNGGPGCVPAGRADAAADRAILLSARYAPGDPWPAEVRNVLAYVLVGRERWAAALHQFRLIGPYATSLPWASPGLPWSPPGDDALGRFLDARDRARLAAAAGVPSRGRAGRARSGGHYA
ncbi:hypothetical protein [Streptomyces sp. NPDC047928]|uniref:hypothetical protein n=1 Tax=unclassified Streptomyces TaxID=2593676 RepID=UPI00371B58E5